MPVNRVVVVGAGAAAVAVARSLRQEGYEGTITALGDEPDAPYDRPPLSKQVLAGEWGTERTALLGRGPDLRVDWQLGVRAARLDIAGRAVHADDGRVFAYDACVIATGVKPRTIPFGDLSGVHVLRTLADTVALKAELGPGTRVVLVGGGFLGLETAATVRALGCEATVIEPVERPLAAKLGAAISARLLALHAEGGVRVLAGTGVQALHGPEDSHAVAAGEVAAGGPPRRVRSVELADGTHVDADVVVVAVGCAPCVDWLEGSGLRLDDGVVCDDHCLAAPGVWAVGDVARWWHPDLDRHLRIEHRMNCNEQGRAVARNILGGDEAFAPVPFFWTDHFATKIQVWGQIPPDAEMTLLDGELDGESFVAAFHHPGGREVAAVLAWNAARAAAAHRGRVVMRAGDVVAAGAELDAGG